MTFVKGEVHEHKIYTGLAKMEVVAINPTMEQLVALGIPTSDPIEYKSRGDNGENKLRVDIWLKHSDPNILVPVKFYLSDKLSVSTKGNLEVINSFGISSYGESIQAVIDRKHAWIEPTTLRQAFEGETQLISFIKAWICIPQGEMAKIDDWSALIKGDLGEITTLMALKPNTQDPKYLVQVLLYVNDNGFQAVYNRFFTRMDSSNTRWWKKQFDNSIYDINYGNDFNLKVFNTRVTPDTISPTKEDDTAKQAWGK